MQLERPSVKKLGHGWLVVTPPFRTCGEFGDLYVSDSWKDAIEAALSYWKGGRKNGKKRLSR